MKQYREAQLLGMAPQFCRDSHRIEIFRQELEMVANQTKMESMKEKYSELRLAPHIVKELRLGWQRKITQVGLDYHEVSQQILSITETIIANSIDQVTKFLLPCSMIPDNMPHISDRRLAPNPLVAMMTALLVSAISLDV